MWLPPSGPLSADGKWRPCSCQMFLWGQELAVALRHAKKLWETSGWKGHAKNPKQDVMCLLHPLSHPESKWVVTVCSPVHLLVDMGYPLVFRYRACCCREPGCPPCFWHPSFNSFGYAPRSRMTVSCLTFLRDCFLFSWAAAPFAIPPTIPRFRFPMSLVFLFSGRGHVNG